MSLVLYYAPQTRALNILWALEELAVPYEKVKLDFSQKEQKSDAFRRINPNGRVPAMVVDGTPMWESLAILTYLGDRYGAAKELWPALDAPERIEALTWSTWGIVTLGANALRIGMSSGSFVPKERHNPAEAAAARTDVEGDLAILDERLATRSFVLGDGFTLADIALGGPVALTARLGLDLAPYAKVKSWWGRVSERPARQKAVQQ